jgi:hypothetical protein
LREGDNAGAATAHSIRSINGRVIPRTAKVGASLQVTFSSPVSEAGRRKTLWEPTKRTIRKDPVKSADFRFWHKADVDRTFGWARSFPRLALNFERYMVANLMNSEC